MRILNAEPEGYSPEAEAIYRDLGEYMLMPTIGPETGYMVSDDHLNPDVVIVRLGFPLTAKLIDEAPALKYIVTPCTGLDHIDVEYAESKGIEVLSLKGETEFLQDVHATAEHTWALLLALVRKIPEAKRIWTSGWDRDRFIGTELHGKTIVVIGYGRVGKQVGAYAKIFGMDLLWADEDTSYAPYIYVANQDIVTIHVPLDDSTRGMIGEAEFAAMKDGAYLINTSRGAVIDESALLVALESGKLAGAALDVLTDEPPKADNPLIRYAREHDNLIITPHIAGNTHESRAKTEIFMANKLKEAVNAKVTV